MPSRSHLCLPDGDGGGCDDGKQVPGARDAKGQNRVFYWYPVGIGAFQRRLRSARRVIVVLDRSDSRCNRRYWRRRGEGIEIIEGVAAGLGAGKAG